MTPIEFARQHLERGALAEEVTFKGESVKALNALCEYVVAMNDATLLAAKVSEVKADRDRWRAECERLQGLIRETCAAIEAQVNG